MPDQTPRSTFKLLFRMYRHVFPLVHEQLRFWRQKAEHINDPELRKQALASIKSKQFHCEGGSFYAAADLRHRHKLVPLIVAFQTISDYLDNLCDRSTSLDPTDFRQLHQAMLDAVDPEATCADYYKFRQEKDDSGYLRALVETCQQHIATLPHYGLVQEPIVRFVSLYSDLQVYKHIHPSAREQQLKDWWQAHASQYPQLRWYEFAAATGSTLGVFMLFQVACEEGVSERRVQDITRAYFPWIAALHILLDYLIDQKEDEEGGDLNFCSYYFGTDDTIERLTYFREQSRKHLASLPDKAYHTMIVEGLLGLYLSDNKVREQPHVRDVSRAVMKKSRSLTMLLYVYSRLHRFAAFRTT